MKKKAPTGEVGHRDLRAQSIQPYAQVGVEVLEMVIFNLPAIPVVMIIAVIVAPLFWLFPTFMERPHGNLVIGLVGALVGGLAEFFGLKGRLFFLPIWLIGMLVGGYASWTIWGWSGAAAGASAIVAVLGALVLFAAWADKRDWERAPQALTDAKIAFGAGDTEQGWDDLDRAFHVPSIRQLTTEICMHDVEVIDVMIGQLEGRVAAVNVSVLRRVQAQLVDASTQEDPQLKDDLVDFVRDLILSRGELNLPGDLSEAKAA